jgi:hypothetical protein
MPRRSTYTFIAVKRDSVYYCGGLTQPYPSEFHFQNHATRKVVIELLAERLYRNQNLRRNEASHVVTVLKDGDTIIRDGAPQWDGLGRYSEGDEDYADAKAMERAMFIEASDILAAAAGVARRRIAAEAEEKEHAKEMRRREEREAARELRRRQFEALKAEFDLESPGGIG